MYECICNPMIYTLNINNQKMQDLRGITSKSKSSLPCKKYSEYFIFLLFMNYYSCRYQVHPLWVWWILWISIIGRCKIRQRLTYISCVYWQCNIKTKIFFALQKNLPKIFLLLCIIYLVGIKNFELNCR